MLTIRNEQMRALEGSVADRLVAEAVDHIRLSLPDIFAELGAPQVRESVLLAYSKSARYALETWSDVISFLNTMYILGFDFDEDPRYPWAPNILQSTDLPSEEKARLLVEAALREARNIAANPAE